LLRKLICNVVALKKNKISKINLSSAKLLKNRNRVIIDLKNRFTPSPTPRKLSRGASVLHGKITKTIKT